MKFWDFKRNAGSVRLMVDFGCENGLSAQQMLAGSSLLPSQLDDHNVELKSEQELQVIRNLLRGLPGRVHGGIEIGLRYRLSTFGIWGYGILSSATGAEAMALAMRFQQLTFTFTQFGYQEQGDTGMLVFEAPVLDTALAEFLVERDMAAGAEIMHEVFGPDFEIAGFSLKALRPRPAGAAAVVAPRVYGATVDYGARVNAIRFDRRVLQQTLPQANPITAAMCVHMCTQLMEKRLHYTSTSALVQQHLLAQDNGPPDLVAVAARMNTSERTLRRRLRDEGVSFSELILKARRSLAETMLTGTDMPLAEIAERVGYSDLSTFSQAFKRWTGMQPSAYRRGSQHL